MLMVRHTMSGGGLAHHAANGGIVHTAHLWEEVMLDLIIEPADIPGEETVVWGEIGGCHHLVHEPGVFHGALCIGLRVVGAFDHMGELEDETQDAPRSEGHREVTDQKLPPLDAEYHERQHDRPSIV